MQGRLRGAPVDFRQRVLKQLDGRQDLGKQRSLFFDFLHTVSHQPLHCLGAVLVEPAEIRGCIPTAYHEDDLVSVVDVGVGKLPSHQLVQHDAVRVHVGLEAERVVILHPDYFWGL